MQYGASVLFYRIQQAMKCPKILPEVRGGARRAEGSVIRWAGKIYCTQSVTTDPLPASGTPPNFGGDF